MSDEAKKYTTIHYQSYLELAKVLDAQHPRSEQLEGKAAHDEMLFIIVHQVYELWFKQIIHELKSVIELFEKMRVDERNIGVAVFRLDRVVEIQKLLIQQIRIMETMTPLDFLDFRNYLFPASGFQSFQFRKVEVMLGLKSPHRLTYNEASYASVFTEEQQGELEGMERGSSLFDLVEAWLERTPFLEFRDFNFLEHYKSAVYNMLERERAAIRSSDYLSPEMKEMRLQMLGGTDTYFQSVLTPEAHEQLRQEGKLRFSYKATIAALLINLYRDEPILQMPFNLLMRLVDIDEMLTSWRYRHAQMVLRMLGRKIGTGGSSGYDYLHATAVQHHIFNDLHNISTLLIPRSELPELPATLKRELGFYFSQKN
jgi:tryptophan 2,3-dioxygenase